jgi:tRNA nucleotidyltransferase (CCA-adding enzyme)
MVLQLASSARWPIPAEAATCLYVAILTDSGRFAFSNTRPSTLRAAADLMDLGAQYVIAAEKVYQENSRELIALRAETLRTLTLYAGGRIAVMRLTLDMFKRTGVDPIDTHDMADEPRSVRGARVGVLLREMGPPAQVKVSLRAHSGVNIEPVARKLGGGGHPQASSALLKGEPGRKTFHALQACLKTMLADAVSATTIMETRVQTLQHNWSLLDASRFLEVSDRNGMPVVDPGGKLCGYLSLRDIMKARRGGQMSAPVSSHMIRRVVSGAPTTSLREIENLFFTHTIYDLPIVDEGKIVGIVTRDAYLKARVGAGSA